MRQVGSSRGAVTAYPRQLESLIRLAEAHARMRLSSKVENVDVEEARRYVKSWLKIIFGDIWFWWVIFSLYTVCLMRQSHWSSLVSYWDNL